MNKRLIYYIRKICRKTPVSEPVFNKVSDLRPATLLKKRNFKNFKNTLFKNTLFTEHLRATASELI